MTPEVGQDIPPDADFYLQPLGLTRFKIDYFSIPSRDPNIVSRTQGGGSRVIERTPYRWSDDVGDPVCWAHLLCQECGAILGQDPHVHVLNGECK